MLSSRGRFALTQLGIGSPLAGGAQFLQGSHSKFTGQYYCGLSMVDIARSVRKCRKRLAPAALPAVGAFVLSTNELDME
jgi:hypothetical protein